MVRTLLPKEEQTRPRPIADTNGSKRRCVSSACIPCRKRKSKCDGGTPACATCTAVYFSPCEYDVESDHRRKGALKRDIESLKERNDALGIIVQVIKSGSDAEVADIVSHIRSGEKLELLAETMRRSEPLLERSASPPSFEGDLSEIMGKPTFDESGETRYFGYTSSLSFAREKKILPRVESPSESWTNVTGDVGFVEHLIDLYFCWQHPFHTVLDEDCFRQDMQAGRTKYCSSILVNAICASASALSDRPEARVDPSDADTAGDHFFDEAKRLLYEQDRSSLTSIQALTLMSVREPNHNRDSTGYALIGRAMRMAMELGLHLSYPGGGPVTLTPTEVNVRKITFWGCFNMETLWGICVGRLPMIPNSAISIEKPVVPSGVFDEEPWKLYIDTDVPFGPESETVGTVRAVTHYQSELVLIINDTLHAFYAPSYRMTSKSLLDSYSKCTAWYESLPPGLLAKNTISPSVLCLNMTYHCFIIHLFRPFLKVGLLQSSVSPRALCRQAATEISALMTVYRNLYGFRRILVFAGHMLLSSGIIHLYNMPSSTDHLVQCIRDLEAYCVCSFFGYRALDIIRSLAQKWGIAIPEEVQDTTQRAADTAVRTICFGIEETAQPSSSSHNSSQASVLVPGEPPFPDDLFWLPSTFPIEPAVTAEPRPMQFTGMSNRAAYDWELLSQDGFKKASVSDPSMGPPTNNVYWS